MTPNPSATMEVIDYDEIHAGSVDLTDTPIMKALNRDLKAAAAALTVGEARYLVDFYYTQQEHRIATSAQQRSSEVQSNAVLDALTEATGLLEKRVKSALDLYTSANPNGQWLKAQFGIGPVLAAGLLAHIDIEKAPTVGHIWRFAGYDPTCQWLGREKAAKLVETVVDTPKLTTDQIVVIAQLLNRKTENIMALARRGGIGKPDLEAPTKASLTSAVALRPWNAKLKVLCWKAGQSFMKFNNQENCFYGHVYAERKRYEIDRNNRGDNKQAAAEFLETHKIGKDTDAFRHYTEGHLPPSQIDARARRYAVKLLLSHLHEVMYWNHYHTMPPKPYILNQPEHVHYIGVPHIDMVPGLAEAHEKAARAAA